MKLRIQKIILSIMALIFAANVYGKDDKTTAPSGRKVISLNGNWQIAEGGMDKIPVRVRP